LFIVITEADLWTSGSSI